MPDLTREQIEAIRDGQLSMDALIREHIQTEFTYRFAEAASYTEAMAVENAVKSGALGRPPRLNPTRRR